MPRVRNHKDEWSRRERTADQRAARNAANIRACRELRHWYVLAKVKQKLARSFRIRQAEVPADMAESLVEAFAAEWRERRLRPPAPPRKPSVPRVKLTAEERKARIKERQRAYRAANVDKYTAAKRAWRLRNPDKIRSRNYLPSARAAQSAYRQRNRDKISAKLSISRTTGLRWSQIPRELIEAKAAHLSLRRAIRAK